MGGAVCVIGEWGGVGAGRGNVERWVGDDDEGKWVGTCGIEEEMIPGRLEKKEVVVFMLVMGYMLRRCACYIYGEVQRLVKVQLEMKIN